MTENVKCIDCTHCYDVYYFKGRKRNKCKLDEETCDSYDKWDCSHFEAKGVARFEWRCVKCNHLMRLKERRGLHTYNKWNQNLRCSNCGGKVKSFRVDSGAEKRCIDCTHATCKPNGNCNHPKHSSAGIPCQDYECSLGCRYDPS